VTDRTASWPAGYLDRISAAEELEIATERDDGSLRPWVPIWVVRVGDDLYVRSGGGTAGAWYRHAVARYEARIRANGIEDDVSLAPAGARARAEISEAYRTKYARYADSYLRPLVSAAAQEATLRLLPRG
jgi:hypothetical protein